MCVYDLAGSAQDFHFEKKKEKKKPSKYPDDWKLKDNKRSQTAADT